MWKWSDLKRLLTRKAAMRDTADLGAVMWPVTYPPTMPAEYIPENAHITVVMFNDINNPDLGYTRGDVIDAVRSTIWDVMLWCNVDGLEWFGEEKNVPVLRVSHNYLEAFHKSIMVELEARGIPVDMTFPEYKPHVTIPDNAALDEAWPDKLLAGPVEVWWGNEHYKVDS